MTPDKKYNYDLVVVRGDAPRNWNETVLRMGGGFYLTSHYARVLQAQGYEPLYFRLARNNIDLGTGLGFLTGQWRRWPIRTLCRGFQWQTHPVVLGSDQEILTDFTNLILQEVRRVGVANILLNSEDSIKCSAELSECGFDITERLEFRIELGPDPQGVLSRISSRKRTYLRSAIKSSTLKVCEVSTMEAVQILIDFQHVSRERRRKRGEDYSIATKSAAESIFRDYIEPGFGRVFLSFQDGVPLSGILLHCWEGRGYYTMSGCSEQGFDVNAPLMTVWSAIERLCSDGYTELNMGGVSATSTDTNDLAHGLYRFKRSFGGSEIKCSTFEKRVPGLRSLACSWLKL